MTPEMGGNATPEQKAAVKAIGERFLSLGPTFADSVIRRLRWTEASLTPQEQGPKRLQAHMVAEILVDEDMSNGIGIMHGGCISFLIDSTTSLTIWLLSYALTGKPSLGIGVTQNLNITMHAPATIGKNLRIICDTLSFGTRTMSARCEVWDTENERLVASGVHIKMEPRLPIKSRL